MMATSRRQLGTELTRGVAIGLLIGLDLAGCTCTDRDRCAQDTPEATVRCLIDEYARQEPSEQRLRALFTPESTRMAARFTRCIKPHRGVVRCQMGGESLGEPPDAPCQVARRELDVCLCDPTAPENRGANPNFAASLIHQGMSNAVIPPAAKCRFVESRQVTADNVKPLLEYSCADDVPPLPHASVLVECPNVDWFFNLVLRQEPSGWKVASVSKFTLEALVPREPAGRD